MNSGRSQAFYFRLTIAAVLVLALVVSLVPSNIAGARAGQSGGGDIAPQAETLGVTMQEAGEIPVLILPIDRAKFLPGALFDFRVEMHIDELPEEEDAISITVNGVDASELFGVEPTQESWEFGSEDDPTPSQSFVWRSLEAPAPGTYTVEVTINGESTSVEWEVVSPQAGAGAENVIFFIADGMTTSMVTAARMISRGMDQGKYNGMMTMDQMEEIGFVTTSGMDSIITDSANSASAYNTGHKSAVNALGVYPDTSPDTTDDPRVETFAEMIKRTRGMSVGIVSTAEFVDASPAAVFAHTRRRGDKAFIAAQAIDEGLEPEVILGGAAAYMIPASVDGSRRDDERDLFTEYEDLGYVVTTTATELEDAFADGTPERLIGMYAPTNLSVWLDRNVYTDNLGDFEDQPGLVEMTLAALEVLGQNENGFYLQVEAASVDKQAHPLDQERMLADLIEFDNALAAAIQWAAENAPNTLIVVTADHGHGYDVIGTVDVEAFNAAEDNSGKVNAIGIYANAGFPTYEDADGDFFPDDWAPSVVIAGLFNNHGTYTEDFQVSSVPRVPSVRDEDGNTIDNPDDDPNGILMEQALPNGSTTGVHTLQDVPVYASGPGADFFGGVMDNTEIFFGMAYAIGLDLTTENGSTTCAGFEFNGICYER